MKRIILITLATLIAVSMAVTLVLVHLAGYTHLAVGLAIMVTLVTLATVGIGGILKDLIPIPD